MMDVTVAYLDPGTGSLIVQVLIASLVAIPVFFRHQIGRFVNTIRRGGGRGNDRGVEPPGD